MALGFALRLVGLRGLRGSRLPSGAAGFAKAMHQVLRGFIDRTIPDARRTAMELALGRLKSSPFPPEVLEGLREEWFGCMEAALGVRVAEWREVPPNQPFYLHAISSTAQLLEDPDWRRSLARTTLMSLEWPLVSMSRPPLASGLRV